MDVTRPVTTLVCSAIVAVELVVAGRLLFRRYRRWTE